MAVGNTLSQDVSRSERGGPGWYTDAGTPDHWNSLMGTRGNKLKLGCIIAILLVLLSPLFWVFGRTIHFKWSLHNRLGDPVEYVEFQPNLDWPKQRVTDQTTIDSLKGWMGQTTEISTLRSAPPAPICEMRFVFKNGREEVIRHSPFRPLLNDSGREHLREGEVSLAFLGYYRSGPSSTLVEILEHR